MLEPDYKDEEITLIRKDRIFVDAIIRELCDSEEYGCKEGDHIYEFSFDIPGVNKDYIHLSVVKKHLDLVARTDDKEYVSHYHFDCEIKYKEAKSHYTNGRLRVIIPYIPPK